MQSGISASQDLHAAFRTLTTTPTQRALLATITAESLTPVTTIPVADPHDFRADLHLLQPHLSQNHALYILLKLAPDAADGYAAITFVPGAAPVREKMLFAATRLALVRELGIERFRTTVFATEAGELTAAGWAAHEASAGVAAPLTAAESGLLDVKEAEAREAQGTGARRGHVAARVDVQVGEGVVEALGGLREAGCRGTLVMLRYAVPGETLVLDETRDDVAPGEVGGVVAAGEPRYSFYSYPGGEEEEEVKILFLYTCPSASKIKERMLYSTGKSWTRTIAEQDAGLTIAKSLEATEPSELTADVLKGEVEQSSAAQDGQDSGRSTPAAGGFARPKRPGRR